MNEHSIFLAALEIADPNQRANYLDQACADDPSLRKQVEALFAVHERSGGFLDVPALKQMAAGQAADATRAEHDARQEEIDLSFLEPSTAPNSLGRLRHYEVREVIGRGGCGIVLKAFDEKLERIVAIKIMAPELAATSPARKRFLREARATAAIRHENVVSIHAVEEQPLPFLVMEYIDGETLQQRLDRTGPLDVQAVLRIGQQIASGLAAAHDKGLIHRDIKPGNVLLEDGTDHIKITDFGLARSADDASMTQSGVIAGTPLYMSPEQAQARSIDHRSDLFSLGSVLYVMCSGRPPFRAASTLAVMKRVVEEQPRPIHDVIPEVPAWMIAIIARLHTKTPEERFASAQEVGTLLARCLSELEQHGRVELSEDMLAMLPLPASESHEPPASEEASVLATVSHPARSHGRRWATAAAIVLVLLAGLGVTEATGVTNVGGTVIRLFSPEGTLVVEVDDPSVSVTIDGEVMVITGASAKEIRLKPGQYKLLASKNGKVVRQELVTVTNNGRQVVRVSRESTPPPDAQAQADEVATSSANDQAEKVRQELRRRNPDFNGVITYLVEDGHVVHWSIIDGTLPALSPLLALKHLKQLNYAAFDPERDAPVLSRMTSLEKINDDSAASYRLAYPENKPPPGVRDEWLETISKLPVKSRVPVVMEKLQEQNPNFDGKYAFRDTDMFLAFDSRAITDISPLAALPELRQLVCSVPFPKRSWLSDLSPLAGMRLTRLECERTRVVDLLPLKGMPLTKLDLSGTRVSDLAPLKGLPLTWLDLFPPQGVPVADLSPLKGMPLEYLDIGWSNATDLSPLEGMPLHYLRISATKVTDLSPLKGMPLTSLTLLGVPVKDIGPLAGMRLRSLDLLKVPVADLLPLKGMPLEDLRIGWSNATDLSPLEGMPLRSLNMAATKVTDLSPLKGMPLQTVWLPNVPTENLDLDVLRGIESLTSINDKPPAQFWKEVEAGMPLPAYDAFAKGNWVPVLTTEDEFWRLMAEQEEGLAEKFRYDNGVLECNAAILHFPTLSGKNVIIRARVKYESGQHVNLRILHPEAEYVAWWNFGGKQFGILRSKDGPSPAISQRMLPEAPPAFFEYALAAVNGKLIAYVDGKALYAIEMTEDQGQSLIPGLGALTGVGLFKNIEIMLLDEVQPAEHRQTGSNDPDAVREELRRRNPEFKGAITYLVEGGRIVRWSIVDGTLDDLSPLLALEHLKELNYADFDPERDAPVVRRLTSLEMINGYSAAAYQIAYPENKPLPGVSDEWLETVAKLPVASRVPVVIEKLQEQNPNFDGKYWFSEEDVALKFDSRAITDISPLKSLPELRRLVCFAAFPSSSWLSDLSPLADAKLQLFDCSRTKVADLSPLKGMPLTNLNIGGTPVEDLTPLAEAKLELLTCNHTKVSDLAPLKGMPLSELVCFQTPISDLSPLQTAPLRILNCSNTRVSDLSPLKETPLAQLYCSTTPIQDLSPLKDMNLTHLTFCNLDVSDLSPLKGMQLTHLDFGGSRRVSDLSPLAGMPLTFVKCPLTRVSDLSPLKGMPLESLWIPEVSAENLQIVRGIESLKQINGKPSPEFWKSKVAP